MRVVRSPDSGGVACGAAAELTQSTLAVIVCECWSSITVVLEGAGLELAGDAGLPPLPEQADTPATNTTTPIPATRGPIRRRAFIATPPTRCFGKALRKPRAYRSRDGAAQRVLDHFGLRPGVPLNHRAQRTGEYGSHRLRSPALLDEGGQGGRRGER